MTRNTIIVIILVFPFRMMMGFYNFIMNDFLFFVTQSCFVEWVDISDTCTVTEFVYKVEFLLSTPNVL